MLLTYVDSWTYVAAVQPGGIEYKDGFLWINRIGFDASSGSVDQYDLNGNFVATYTAGGNHGGLAWDGDKWWTSGRGSTGRWLNEDFTFRSTFTTQGSGFVGDDMEYRYDPITDTVWSNISSIVETMYKLNKTTGAVIASGHSIGSGTGMAIFPGPDGRPRMLMIQYIGDYLYLFDENFMILDRVSYAGLFDGYNNEAQDIVWTGEESPGVDNFYLVGRRSGVWKIIKLQLQHSIPVTTDWRAPGISSPVAKRGHKVRAVGSFGASSVVADHTGSPIVYLSYPSSQNTTGRKALLGITLRPADMTVIPTYVGGNADLGDSSPAHYAEAVVPAGTQVGDLLLLLIQDAGKEVTTPNAIGWTRLIHASREGDVVYSGMTVTPSVDETYPTDVWEPMTTVWYKFAQGVDLGATISLLDNRLSEQIATGIVAYSGIDQDNPVIDSLWDYSALSGVHPTANFPDIEADGPNVVYLAIHSEWSIGTQYGPGGMDGAYWSDGEAFVLRLSLDGFSTPAFCFYESVRSWRSSRDGFPFKLVLTGGYTVGRTYQYLGSPGGTMDQVQVLDLDALTWSSGTAMPGHRYNHASCVHQASGEIIEDGVFEYTGSYQEYIVPSDTTTLVVDLYGARGGNGGLGGYIRGSVAVTPGEVLRIFVGGEGGVANPVNAGWNGGGIGRNTSTDGYGGGGATDIRRSPYGLADRLAVAGGGGGYGGSSGGTGGYPTGGSGGMGFYFVVASGGGSQSSGGVAGHFDPTGGDGENGSLGEGGDAGSIGGDPATLGVGGGGGGGGYYGGGGGALEGGGGGGGSSGVPFGSVDTYENGVRSGNGTAIVNKVSTMYSSTGGLYVFGGINQSGTLTNTCWGYDTLTDEWISFTESPYAHAGAVAISDGRYIYLYGGVGTETLLVRFDPLINEWVSLTSSPVGQRYHGGVAYNGKLYFPGGQLSTGTTTRDMNVYHIGADTWTNLPNFLDSGQPNDERDAVVTRTGQMVWMNTTQPKVYDLTVWPPVLESTNASQFWQWDEMSADLASGVMWMIGGYPTALGGSGYGDPGDHSMSPGVPFALRIAAADHYVTERGKITVLGVTVETAPSVPITIMDAQAPAAADNVDARDGTPLVQAQLAVQGVEYQTSDQQRWTRQ